MSDASSSLLQALLLVQREIPDSPIVKDKTNPAFKSRYASLDAVMDSVRPLLSRNGLVWLTTPSSNANGEPTLGYRLVHAETGEAITGEMPLLLGRNDAQGLGSSLTYSRRYSLMAVLGLTADEDDDGNAASRRAQPKQAAAPTNGASLFASEQDVIEIREAAKGLQPDQIKLALAASGVPSGTPSERIPRDKVVSVIKALGMSERTP